MSLFQPIHHTFGPHVNWRYCMHSELLLMQPWRWQHGADTKKLRQALAEKFTADAHLFSSGREGLLALLQSLNFPPGSEIIIQGYTCVALPNALHAAGYTPVYADIERDTLNLDPSSVAERITPRTKAIICQHTFGIPSDTKALKTLCDEHSLQLIEDCAHIMSGDVGHDGNFVMLSFGRDKAISGIAGGAILSRNSVVSDVLSEREAEAPSLPFSTIGRLLWYPDIYWVSRWLYGFGVGKALLALARKLRLLVPVLTKDEKLGHMENRVHRMPNACCALALRELKQLNTLNNHRLEIAQLYAETFPDGPKPQLGLQKYPLLVEDADAIRRSLKQHNIHLEDGWTGAVVCPRTSSQLAANYDDDCPIAEQVAKEVLCLPTHPTMNTKQATRLIEILQETIHTSTDERSDCH